MAFPVVHEDGVWPTEGHDDQVLITVAVDVGEHASGRMAIPRRQAGARGDVLELPIAQVAIQDAWTFGTGQKDIGPSVAIHVRQTHAGSLPELAVWHQ